MQGNRRRRQHVGEVSAPDERRVQHRVTRRRLEIRQNAFDSKLANVRRTHVGGLLDAEGDDTAGETRHPGHDQGIVGVGHQHGVRRRLVEDFRLGVRNRVNRVKELEMRRRNIGPHAHLWLGDGR